MIPIVTPEEMGAIDRDAPEPEEVLIDRAGGALARAILRRLGGGYGRRVLVLAGKGNNGADGRVAATKLARHGVRSLVVEAADPIPPGALERADLVVDAIFGTGFRDRGGWAPPDVGGTPVLAVDIPSGVNGLTGETVDGVPAAGATVTFAALKPGLLLLPGRSRVGELELVDIGLDTSRARAHLVTAADVAEWLPGRPVDMHKWKRATWIVAGSPGMTGAAHLATASAMRAGASYVRLSTPGVESDPMAPTEAVSVSLPAHGWASDVLASAERFGSIAVGPGLGRSRVTTTEVRRLVAEAPVPIVVDGDGLHALGDDADRCIRRRAAATILTPHDGEAAVLAGRRMGADRFAEARELATRTGAVVLLKGPTTVIADPDGDALAVTSGDARLATAGTGDVLTGAIAAFAAMGVDPLRAAAAGAHVHGAAAARTPAEGMVASDLPGQLPAVLTALRAGPGGDGA
ncbi:MAG: NAD(P)H-hydrate dehydratase [Actinomycetota bacterium]|nr:NAD(P)H-hydrate dehydratase [Actinomycetota bacterium]